MQPASVRDNSEASPRAFSVLLIRDIWRSSLRCTGFISLTEGKPPRNAPSRLSHNCLRIIGHMILSFFWCTSLAGVQFIFYWNKRQTLGMLAVAIDSIWDRWRDVIFLSWDSILTFGPVLIIRERINKKQKYFILILRYFVLGCLILHWILNSKYSNFVLTEISFDALFG